MIIIITMITMIYHNNNNDNNDNNNTNNNNTTSINRQMTSRFAKNTLNRWKPWSREPLVPVIASPPKFPSPLRSR